MGEALKHISSCACINPTWPTYNTSLSWAMPRALPYLEPPCPDGPSTSPELLSSPPLWQLSGACASVPASSSRCLCHPPDAATDSLTSLSRGRMAQTFTCLAPRLLPRCMKRNDEPEPFVSYRVADEEVQLPSPDNDLPDIYQTVEFSSDSRPVMPPPPHYSMLPQLARRPSHGELSQSLSTLSN
jgi:hypothetical protein